MVFFEWALEAVELTCHEKSLSENDLNWVRKKLFRVSSRVSSRGRALGRASQRRAFEAHDLKRSASRLKTFLREGCIAVGYQLRDGLESITAA